MKPHLDITHEGNLGDVEDVAFSFDEASIDHLMSLLIDLYSDQALAVVREYSTNALDAHIEAGNPGPIHITTPSALNPVLIIQDFGVGMSVNQITDQLTKYGWSSKRETNEQNGMLGLGFKSGLTYAMQFTVRSVKNGMVTVVLVTRKETGGAALKVIDTASTQEPNGTTITIPVKNVMLMNEKIVRFFRFWERGTVLIDGEEPTPIWEHDGALQLDPDIFIFDVHGHGDQSCPINTSYVVMGGVAYPVSSKKLLTDFYSPDSNVRMRLRDPSWHAVMRVPIGSFNFTPNREALQDTHRTTQLLQEAAEFMDQVRFRTAQQAVDACLDHRTAWGMIAKWQNTTSGRLTYKGDRPDPRIGFKNWIDDDKAENGRRDGYYPIKVFAWVPPGTEDKGTVLKANGSRTDTYDLMTNCVLMVTGFAGRSVAAGTKERARHFMKLMGTKGPNSRHESRYKHILFCVEKPSSPWIAHIPTVEFSKIKDLQLPVLPGMQATSTPTPTRQRNKWQWIQANSTRPAEDIPDNLTPIAWIKTGDAREGYIRNMVYEFVKDMKGYGIVPENAIVLMVNKDREKLLEREYPDLPHFHKWVNDLADQTIAAWTAWDSWAWKTENTYRYSRSVSEELYEVVRTLAVTVTDDNAALIRDRDLVDFVNQYRGNGWSRSRVLSRIVTLTANYGSIHIKVPCIPETSFKTLANFVMRMNRRYPLLRVVMSERYSLPGNAVVDYLNDTYMLRVELALVPLT